MGTVTDMLRRAQAINIPDAVGDILEDHTTELADLNKKQLMQGKNNKGELLSPRHSENPWFKKPGAALRYAEWKQRLFPETPFDVANLTIKGYYHGTIVFSRQGNYLNADATASFAASIEATFNNTALGLNRESAGVAMKEIIHTPLIQKIKEDLNL